jgi:hypothetical protein
LQYSPLTDGTYFITPWLATADRIPKTVMPIGYDGVAVGKSGHFAGRSIRLL